MPSKKEQKQTEKQEAIKTLRKMGLRPGKRVYTSCSHVARSGMSRHISVYIVTRNTWTEPGPTADAPRVKRAEDCVTDITGFVGRAIDYRRAKDGGLVVGGCGMDMGFAVVYALGWAMFPKGGDVKHSQRRHQEERAGNKRETDGGYLLKHDWL